MSDALDSIEEAHGISGDDAPIFQPPEMNEGGDPVSVSDTEVRTHTAPDLVKAFFADVAHVGLLTRHEEEILGNAVAAQRAQILKLLRRRPALVDEALKSIGRGVVHPDHDFREREALAVLNCARQRVQAMRRLRRRHKALSKFVSDLQREMNAYRELRNRMMTANVRLVMTLARRYHHPTLSHLDLVQEGIFGLLRGVEKYEPSRGIKFSTYAGWWIWQQIARAADSQGAVIRTPVHWNQLRRKVNRAGRQPGGDKDPEAAVEEYGVSPERLAAMVQSFQCLSLAAPLGDDERTLADTLPADPADNPEGAMLVTDLGQRLRHAVGELPDREAEILRLRFGLNGAEENTLEEIGHRFGVSRERIRQLEARALKQMRAICDAQGLSEALH